MHGLMGLSARHSVVEGILAGWPPRRNTAPHARGSGPDGWTGVAYVWNAEQTEAIARPEGADNVLATAHDVPSARACMTCHGGRSHRILGFSAIQLSHAPASAEDLTLAEPND
jgi:hypothetical protein